MNVATLSLVQFRSHLSSSFPTNGAPLVLLSGANGSGKTSVLEALYLLAAGIGIKTRRDSELVRFDSDGYRVAAETSEGLKVALKFQPAAGRTAFVDDVALTRWGDLIGRIRATLLKPDDIGIIEGGPELRRRFVDVMLCQSERAYLDSLRRYRRAYKQKNVPQRISVSAPFEKLMAEEMPLIFAARAAACESLKASANTVLSRMGDGRHLELRYKPAVPAGSASDWKFAAARCIEESRRLEAAGVPSVFGPGRDEIEILLDGVNLRKYGSQGQKRLVAIVLKVAEAERLSQSGSGALILVDDVLGELDAARNAALLEILSGSGKQVWIADTDVKSYEEHWPMSAKFDIKDGFVRSTNYT